VIHTWLKTAAATFPGDLLAELLLADWSPGQTTTLIRSQSAAVLLCHSVFWMNAKQKKEANSREFRQTAGQVV